MADELLQDGLGDRHAGDFGRLELKLPPAVFCSEPPGGRHGQPSGEIRHGIEPAALLLFSHGVEIDHRAAGNAPVTERVQRRLQDADRNLIGRVESQVRIHFDVRDRRGAGGCGAGGSRLALLDDSDELGLETVGVLFRETSLGPEGRDPKRAEEDQCCGTRTHILIVANPNRGGGARLHRDLHGPAEAAFHKARGGPEFIAGPDITAGRSPGAPLPGGHA
jgi:hypothetical protein